MSADAYESVLGLLLMGTGNDNNSWGDNANNAVFKLAARAIAGIATHADTGGALNLATVTPPAGASSALDHIHDFTGTLSSDLTVTMPSVSKTWLVRNNTAGAFFLYVKTAAGTSVQVPQGTTKLLFCDGTNVKRSDADQVGNLVHSAKAAVDSGTLQCNGASLLRTAYPDLFAKIGTTWGAADGVHFTLPDFVTNNRFLRAAGGSLAVGTTQSNQNKAHTHTITGAPAVGTLAVDSGGAHTHTANVTDPGHTHTYSKATGQYTAAGGGSAEATLSSTVATGSSTTGISVAIVSGGAHTHTLSGAMTAGTLATASDGGTEARPENAAVLICIKY